jgi:hypothetical protein
VLQDLRVLPVWVQVRVLAVRLPAPPKLVPSVKAVVPPGPLVVVEAGQVAIPTAIVIEAVIRTNCIA